MIERIANQSVPIRLGYTADWPSEGQRCKRRDRRARDGLSGGIRLFHMHGVVLRQHVSVR